MPEPHYSATEIMRSLGFEAPDTRKFTGNRTTTPAKIDFLQKLGLRFGSTLQTEDRGGVKNAQMHRPRECFDV